MLPGLPGNLFFEVVDPGPGIVFLAFGHQVGEICMPGLSQDYLEKIADYRA